ncbi:MAG TPA: GNAT family N-acetyltransferase [Candidatus Limnocylindrales bacterium]|nr:GNAT family N-acetyltransferase [Candidatus Limnocylindrales bacterium]
MHIEPYHPDHLAQIIALSLRAWAPVFASLEKAMPPALYDHFYPDWRDSQRKVVEKTCMAEDSTVWVSRVGQQVVGFAALKLDAEDGMGEIYMIAVDPDHQRSGVATALMQHALAWMKQRGVAVAMVETGADPGHAPARRTYESLGFSEFRVARYFLKL